MSELASHPRVERVGGKVSPPVVPSPFPFSSRLGPQKYLPVASRVFRFHTLDSSQDPAYTDPVYPLAGPETGRTRQSEGRARADPPPSSRVRPPDN